MAADDGWTPRKRCRRRVRGINQGDPIGAVAARLFTPPFALMPVEGNVVAASHLRVASHFDKVFIVAKSDDIPAPARCHSLPGFSFCLVGDLRAPWRSGGVAAFGFAV